MHIPPIDPTGTRNGAFASRDEAVALFSELQDFDVDLTLYGHVHSFYDFDNAGIPAVISGGGGAIPERFDDIGRHFVVFDVDPLKQSFTKQLVRASTDVQDLSPNCYAPRLARSSAEHEIPGVPRLFAELLVVYLAGPLVMDQLASRGLRYVLLPGMWLIAAVLVWRSARLDPMFWNHVWALPQQKAIWWAWSLRTLLGVAVPGALAARLVPEHFLMLPRRTFGLWLLIAVLYPLLSVVPQGFIFRAAGCIQRMARLQRQVVLLSLLDEQPRERVAATLEISPEYLRVLLHRAREHVRNCAFDDKRETQDLA